MSDQWLREKIRDIGLETPPARFPLESVLRRGAAARRRRSATRTAAVTAAVLLTAVAVPGVLRGATAVAPADAAPSVLTITCAGGTTAVSGGTVAASADGVHFQVANPSGDAGGSVGYQPTDRSMTLSGLPGAAGAGEVLSARDQEIVWTVTPGSINVSCQQGGANSPAVQVVVVDPAGFYRPGNLQDLGCHGAGMTEWVGPVPTGSTAEEALQRLTTKLENPSSLSAVAARLGYEKAREQLYFLRTGTENRAVAVVEHHAGGFSAGLYSTCS